MTLLMDSGLKYLSTELYRRVTAVPPQASETITAHPLPSTRDPRRSR